jgi:predicted site-specific integrase-resolvase
MGKGQGSEEVEESSWEETVSNKKVAAIYVRCSTAEQETDMQETELREYCGRRGWEQILYRDKGQSGAKQDRPALNLLLNDLRKRKVDVILVWSLDRLARSLKQLLTISEECRSLGVDLVSLRQNIDTTLPAGRLTFQILGAVAEFERELLRDRGSADLHCDTLVRLNWNRYGYCGGKVPVFANWRRNWERHNGWWQRLSLRRNERMVWRHEEIQEQSGKVIRGHNERSCGKVWRQSHGNVRAGNTSNRVPGWSRKSRSKAR